MQLRFVKFELLDLLKRCTISVGGDRERGVGQTGREEENERKREEARQTALVWTSAMGVYAIDYLRSVWCSVLKMR